MFLAATTAHSPHTAHSCCSSACWYTHHLTASGVMALLSTRCLGQPRLSSALQACQWRRIQHSIHTCRLQAYSSNPGQQLLAVPCPPEGYDYKAEILPETLDIVQKQYPKLLPLVEEGNLVVYQRPASYVERRTDGYQEPKLIFILGTAHVSQQSAVEVEQVVAAVRPESVVVELCKSRVGILQMPDQESSHEQQQQQQQQQRQLGAKQATLINGSPSSSLEEDAAAIHERISSNEQASTSSSRSMPDRYGNSSRAAEQYWKRRNQAAASLAAQGSINVATTWDADNIDSWGNSSVDVDGRQQEPATTAAPTTSSSSSSSSSKAANPMSLTGTNFLSAITRSAQLGGQSGLLLRLLIAGQTRKVADQLGVQPGAEFRAAAGAADAVGASLVLGDRPIEITLQRAWGALSWQRRLQLLADLMSARSGTAGTKELTVEAVEKFRSDDAVSSFFNALSAAYPELINPLIAERDVYLAWSLKRSKAVNGTHAVVGVVGKGHLRGIVYALKHDDGKLRFADLVGGKNRKKSRQEATAMFAKRLLFELLLGAGLYAAWVAVTSGAQQ